MDDRSFYGIDGGLWDRESVKFRGRETAAQGLDFISKALEVPIPA